MSTTDKTRQKLMESMRKTKAAASNKTDSNKPTSAPVAAPKTKPVSRQKDPKKQSVKVQPGSDPYQSGRRIWPD